MKNFRTLLILIAAITLSSAVSYAACPADFEVEYDWNGDGLLNDGRNRYGYLTWQWPYLKATNCGTDPGGPWHANGPYQGSSFETLKSILLRRVSNDIKADEDAVRFATGYFDKTWLQGSEAKITGVPPYNPSLIRGATFTTNASADLKGVFQTIAHKIKIRLTK